MTFFSFSKVFEIKNNIKAKYMHLTNSPKSNKVFGVVMVKKNK